MNFNFPNFITIDNWGLQGINYVDPQLNQITIDNTDYIFKLLSPYGNKGGNSVILKVYSDANISNIEDYDLLEDKMPDKILKILKYPFKKGFRGKSIYKNSHKRFLNEIRAIEICNKHKSQNVIDLYENGECQIKQQNYLYYTMEVADCDLKEFIENHHTDLDYASKIKFCIELLEGLKEIDSNNFYHRDIKPDNIFIVNGTWKIGDLGLVDGRQLEYKLDESSKFIGPRGWISPEVMNKYLTEGKSFKKKFDCIIDTQSDLFQMGKIFWYIFQHNAPIGTVKQKDFNSKYKEVYPVIKRMLNYDKDKRFQSIDEIIILLKKIQLKLLLS
ncbi:protein kinase domain-containing protein [Winogradskyella vincentii]|uniref:Protein kinase n=1 Tax=Winogradskyella vincentii TaxID=2877122 RepID=A0ABS7XVQ1_9FLAO|nr:protein kinase [Winogradskyella vincentii]MCA0151717.1 protein kinase [Winogradskyella vincentii]